jgi:hypothetical protein
VLRTRSLIVADGAASGTAARLGCRAARRAVRRVGSSSAWRVIEGELQPWVQVFLFSRGEVYLTPTGKSSANVSLLGAPEFVSSLLPTEALSNWLVQHREKLGASFELESPALGAGPLNSFRLGAVLSGALLVGDACETFDPIGDVARCRVRKARSSGRSERAHDRRLLGSGTVVRVSSAQHGSGDAWLYAHDFLDAWHSFRARTHAMGGCVGHRAKALKRRPRCRKSAPVPLATRFGGSCSLKFLFPAAKPCVTRY